MALDALQWPTPDDYTTAMSNLDKLAVPEWLKRGQVERDQFNNVRTFSGAGLYTRTYKVRLTPSPENPSGLWMARCFCNTGHNQPPADIDRRYPKISVFCNGHLSSVSALLHIRYIEQALKVLLIDECTLQLRGETVVPIVMMPFVDNALPLGTYIAMHYRERERMEELCRAWLNMMREMHWVHMAHGDLDLTNVLVQEKAGRLYLKLIDYDNIWIPALKKFPLTELGHDGFQHPMLANKSRPYDATMDRYAALSIYISIRALSFYPELYLECRADDTYRLLFSREDYLKEINQARSPYLMSDASNMSTISKIKSKNNPYLTPYLADLCYSLYNNCMPNYNVYDVPPNLGEYGMPEPPREPVTAHDTSYEAAPPAESIETDDMQTLAPPPQPLPRQRKSTARFVIIAIVIILIIAAAIAIYLVIHAHSQTTLNSSGELPLLATIHQWGYSLPTHVEWRMV